MCPMTLPSAFRVPTYGLLTSAPIWTSVRPITVLVAPTLRSGGGSTGSFGFPARGASSLGKAGTTVSRFCSVNVAPTPLGTTVTSRVDPRNSKCARSPVWSKYRLVAETPTTPWLNPVENEPLRLAPTFTDQSPGGTPRSSRELTLTFKLIDRPPPTEVTWLNSWSASTATWVFRLPVRPGASTFDSTPLPELIWYAYAARRYRPCSKFSLSRTLTVWSGSVRSSPRSSIRCATARLPILPRTCLTASATWCWTALVYPAWPWPSGTLAIVLLISSSSPNQASPNVTTRPR